ncbi:MAG: acyl carrier protein [Bacillota bacterium]|jgi:acyl carrier protein
MTDTIEQLRTILQEKVPGATGIEIMESTSLRTDLGLDTLKLVDLMVAIEARFEITFDEADLNPGELQYVRDLQRIIEKTKGKI